MCVLGGACSARLFQRVCVLLAAAAAAAAMTLQVHGSLARAQSFVSRPADKVSPRILPPFLHNHPHLAAPTPGPPKAQPPATLACNTAPSPPLQPHVLILLGRCLQLRRKQAAADAARRRSRQLRGDGETGCRVRCVCCTWLVTLLLRRLLRIA